MLGTDFSSQLSSNAFIVIAGNIGSGKTTLTKQLAHHLQFKPHFESVEDNPYLSDFYSDMSRWSFPLQVHFLTHRYVAHKNIVESQSSAIQDRSIYEDANIFARALFEDGKMEQRDYENYLRLYDVMTKQLQYPSLMIYLKRSVPKLVERIKLRGRDYEKTIPVDYLDRLNGYYDDWFNRYTGGKSILIDTDSLDFLENPDHFKYLVGQIVDSFDQKDFFFSPPPTGEMILN